jgi:hypothetical protein
LNRLDHGLKNPFPAGILNFPIKSETLNDLASPLYLPPHLGFGNQIPNQAFLWEDMPEVNRVTDASRYLHYTPVYRQFGGFERELHLFFFNIEGVTLFWNLFARRGISPEILCLKRAERYQRNWTSFRVWNEALGRCVADITKKPKIVCAGCPSETDWPWTRQWQKHSDWEGAISKVRPDDPWPIIKQDSRIQNGIVTVELRGCDLPEGIRILRRSSDIPTLLHALKTLPRRKHLEIAIDGFADEGCSLIEWRQNQTKERHLVIYTESPGDLTSFGPYVDKITLDD